MRSYKGFAAYNAGDYATALRERTSLAKQGNASAQFFLGYMYGNVEGVQQNYKTAAKWCTPDSYRPISRST